MPIVFSCASCARPLRVPDDAAGKKTRCPACGTIAAAPSAEPQFEVVEHPPPPAPPPVEVNYADAPTPPPARPTPRRDTPDDPTPLKLADEPPRRKKRRKRRGLGPSGRVDRERSPDEWFRTKQVMFIGLGSFLCVGAIAAIVAGEHPRRYIQAVCLFIVGIGLIIRGLTGDFEDH